MKTNEAVKIRAELMKTNLKNNLWFVPTIDIKYATAAAKQFANREMKILLRKLNENSIKEIK